MATERTFTAAEIVTLQLTDSPRGFWHGVRHVPETGCWERIGRKSDGYVNFKVKGKSVKSHRWAYESLVGPIHSGLELDHLCRNRACVNPSHLEPVTTRENLLRSELTLAGQNARKTTCPKGHPYDASWSNGRGGQGRQCRQCSSDKRAGECPHCHRQLASVWQHIQKGHCPAMRTEVVQ